MGLVDVALRGASLARFSVGRPAQYAQDRRITSYLKDVLRSGSFSPPNPLLDLVEQPDKFPDLGRAQPHHVAPAASKLRDIVSEMDFGTETTRSESLEYVLAKLDAVHGRAYSLRQVVSLLWLVSDSSEKNNWRKALEEVQIEDDGFSAEQVDAIYHFLSQKKDNMPTGSTIGDIFAVSKWTQDHEFRTGLQLTCGGGYSRLQKALIEIEITFQSADSEKVKPSQSKQLLGGMYNYVGIKERQAKCLGYDSFAAQTLESRMATVDDIKLLHNETFEGIKPIIAEEAKKVAGGSTPMLDNYLQSTNPKLTSTSKLDPKLRDKAMMLRLENHVTLDGALDFLSKLSSDLLGVSIVEEQSGGTYHPDVRLFHVYDQTGSDEETKIGSFFLDAYSRPGKCSFPFTSSLVNKGGGIHSTTALAAVSLSLDPPAWDTESATMSWDDVEALFHEMGHVYQIVLSKSTMGTLLGAHNLPLDFSEIMPKFMEYFLTERSTIYTLMSLSQPPQPLEFAAEKECEAALDAAFRVRSEEKAFKLARQIFFGELELSLFSSFDVRGGETMFDLQDRLASTFIPHDLPGKREMGPLIDIFKENSDGRAVAQYRYLWCDALAACMFESMKSSLSSQDTAGNKKFRETFLRVAFEEGAAMQPEHILQAFQVEPKNPAALLRLYKLDRE